MLAEEADALVFDVGELDDSLAGTLLHLRIQTSFSQLPIAQFIVLFNLIVTALILSPVAAPERLITWEVAGILITSLRLITRAMYYRSKKSRENRRLWFAVLLFGAIGGGLTWGVLPIFFWLQGDYRLFPPFAIAGMCAAAVTVSYSSFTVLAGFILPATIPLIVRYLTIGTAEAGAMATMTSLFTVLLLFIGSRVSTNLENMLSLQLNLEGRTRELREANRRLEAEIVEHRATEESLRQAQKLEALGQLTGGIAHDFNNLLTIIIGSIVMILQRAGQDATTRRQLDAALQAADRGALLIQRLLAFARRQSLIPKLVDLRTLISGIEQLLRRTLGPAVTLKFEFAEEPCVAFVDPNQLELALLNLVINSRDAMEGIGQITLAVGVAGSVDSRWIDVGITDSGPGMSQATLARAVEPYFTTKGSTGGSGLGLSMVQGFAMQSGGALDIQSEIGKGTSVSIRLPWCQPEIPEAAIVHEARVELPSQTLHILVCDDEPAVCQVIAEELRSAGHDVLTAFGPSEALRSINDRQQLDLLITDFAMPEMNGAELIKLVRARKPDLKCLVISGYGEEAHESGVPADVLSKPFTPDGLMRCVATMFGQKIADEHCDRT